VVQVEVFEIYIKPTVKAFLKKDDEVRLKSKETL